MTDRRAPAAPTAPPARPPGRPPGRTGASRSAADWLGFVGFLVFAAWLVTGPGALGPFLLVPVLYEIAIAVTFLVRARPQRSAGGMPARLTAYAATFLIPVFVRLSLIWRPSLVAMTPLVSLRVAGASLLLFGLVMGFWPLWHLRGSFSVEPAARQLVTSGPYQIARHPIYASYVLNYAGLVLLRPTPSTAAVYVVWLALTRLRARYEERVLSDAFPEYATYRRKVGAFGPRFWRRAGDAVSPVLHRAAPTLGP